VIFGAIGARLARYVWEFNCGGLVAIARDDQLGPVLAPWGVLPIFEGVGEKAENCKWKFSKKSDFRYSVR
jgi:hypothetical protein